MTANQDSLSTTEVNPIDYHQASATRLAWLDITQGCQQWQLWLMLAYQDIKLRYRRSILGPFWITLSMAITVYAMGFLYGHLFRTDLAHYYPFLVAGMLAWALVQNIIIEVNDAFTGQEGLIKQVKLPYSVYIHRIIARNMLIFFHNIIVMLPIFIIFNSTVKINADTLLLIPGLILIYINGAIYGLILAMLGARYRDFSQMVKSLIQVVFFVTPVMWNPVILSPHNRAIIYCNPFYSFLELIRAPLLGTMPTVLNLLIVGVVTLIGALGCWKLFMRHRARIIYWL